MHSSVPGRYTHRWRSIRWSVTLVGALVALAVLTAIVGGSGVASQPIEERITYSYNTTDGTILAEYRYDVFNRLVDIEVDALSVRHAEHVDRQSNTTFEWNDVNNPRIVLRLDPAIRGADSHYFASEDGGFVPAPRSGVSYRYRANSPPGVRTTRSVDGEGYAGDSYVYVGPHDLYEETAAGVQWTVVTGAGATPKSDSEALVDLFEQGERLTRARVEYDAVAVFVMPAMENQGWLSGQASQSEIYLEDTAATIGTIDNTPAHEYFHVRLGNFGDGEMQWLTEASAEYYGELLSLNAGLGTYEEFIATVRTDDHRDAVLADQDTDDRNRAEYEKGAHVLAALDAEIRRQTGGEDTLESVVVGSDRNLSTYSGFKAAVIDVTGNESMGTWVDRYVRTEAIPPVPDSKQYYTLDNQTAADFLTPTPTPTPTATPTPTPSPTPTFTPTATPAATAEETQSPATTTPATGAARDSGGSSSNDVLALLDQPLLTVVAVLLVVAMVSVALLDARRG